ncbi:NAD(P)H-dependent oxidoreductase [Acidisoma cellulosilytica]|uniref:NAD(P)H-dependent oxidoreductase n=1 Tax=Acidisoma cellulosilyticum TaxID=2802395 RepID=A0A964E6Q3_9PROT|nr:NAD(P)H-dependent oxidoreductase [Acidisoma cellulosilyticum]MCB8883248.1 NAD(P)H-dependent oxidoreductase [Acidisoma cellulosilyticum]
MALGFIKTLTRTKSPAKAGPRRLAVVENTGSIPAQAAAGRAALVLLSHPAMHRSRVNAALLGVARERPDVTVHDLYRHYPDFLIDVETEQKKLIAHRLIVLQFPMYWYATPALLKEWMDTVLLHGFAFGRGGTQLHGKTLMVAASTGGDPDAYQPEGMNRFTMTELLRPLEATAHLCGLAWAEPFIVHDAIHLNAEGRTQAAVAYDARLSALIEAANR